MTVADEQWAQKCRCGHPAAQHRGAKRRGGCFGWRPSAEPGLRRCDCKAWRSPNPRPQKPKDDRPLAKVIPLFREGRPRRR